MYVTQKLHTNGDSGLICNCPNLEATKYSLIGEWKNWGTLESGLSISADVSQEMMWRTCGCKWLSERSQPAEAVTMIPTLWHSPNGNIRTQRRHHGHQRLGAYVDHSGSLEQRNCSHGTATLDTCPYSLPKPTSFITPGMTSPLPVVNCGVWVIMTWQGSLLVEGHVPIQWQMPIET